MVPLPRNRGKSVQTSQVTLRVGITVFNKHQAEETIRMYKDSEFRKWIFKNWWNINAQKHLLFGYTTVCQWSKRENLKPCPIHMIVNYNHAQIISQKCWRTKFPPSNQWCNPTKKVGGSVSLSITTPVITAPKPLEYLLKDVCHWSKEMLNHSPKVWAHLWPECCQSSTVLLSKTTEPTTGCGGCDTHQ